MRRPDGILGVCNQGEERDNVSVEILGVTPFPSSQFPPGCEEVLVIADMLIARALICLGPSLVLFAFRDLVAGVESGHVLA